MNGAEPPAGAHTRRTRGGGGSTLEQLLGSSVGSLLRSAGGLVYTKWDACSRLYFL